MAKQINANLKKDYRISTTVPKEVFDKFTKFSEDVKHMSKAEYLRIIIDQAMEGYN